MKWYDVRVSFDDGDMIDAIKGSNEDNALDNAYDNWEQAEHIELIDEI